MGRLGRNGRAVVRPGVIMAEYIPVAPANDTPCRPALCRLVRQRHFDFYELIALEGQYCHRSIVSGFDVRPHCQIQMAIRAV